jgi:mycofactocin precursor
VTSLLPKGDEAGPARTTAAARERFDTLGLVSSDTIVTPLTADSAVADEDLDAEELLVEEISIDGMCGVY